MDKISFFKPVRTPKQDKINQQVDQQIDQQNLPSDESAGARSVKNTPAAQEKNLPTFIKKYTPLMNKMVFLLAQKHRNLASYKDDIADAALRGVVKAAQTYDERRGSLTNYVVNCIRNEMYTFLRWYNRYSPRVVPIDVAFPPPPHDNGGAGGWSGYDNIPDPHDIEETILNKIIVDRISEIASAHGEQYAKIFRLLAAGMNQNEVAKELGVTHQRVSKIIFNLRKWYVERYGDGA